MACSEWTGVPLSVLLDEVGLRDGASWIIAEAADGGKHTKSIPLGKALDDVLVAYGQTAETLPEVRMPSLDDYHAPGTWTPDTRRGFRILPEP